MVGVAHVVSVMHHSGTHLHHASQHGRTCFSLFLSYSDGTEQFVDPCNVAAVDHVRTTHVIHFHSLVVGKAVQIATRHCDVGQVVVDCGPEVRGQRKATHSTKYSINISLNGLSRDTTVVGTHRHNGIHNLSPGLPEQSQDVVEL